jgi:RHS repeat-associated protein
MKNRFARFVRWCVMVLGTVLAVACGHGPDGPGAVEHTGETAQPVTLAFPSGPVVSSGKVGTLPGGGEVGPSGDYRYTLPIEVPQGRAGMTPALSLSYSSTAGNGVVGVGWSLGGGISRITKCNKTIAIDGFAEHLSALCLDGARLVDIGNGEWRTEHDTFTRIRAAKNQHDWLIGYVVERKDGRILRYMEKTASAWYHDQTSDHVLYGNFALSSEEDRDGNTLNYHYASGQLYPYLTEIYYGNAAELNPSTPDDTGSRRIIFNYEDRPDTVYRHVDSLVVGGQLQAHEYLADTIGIERRLSSISCVAPGPKDPRNPASETAWAYQLSYLQSTGSGSSILTSVVRTGALGGTSFAKKFAWQQTKGGTYTKVVTAIGPFGLPSAVDIATTSALVLDVDNDGKDELLVNDGLPSLLSTGASGPVLGQTKNLGWLSNLTFNNARVADLDGDGIPEILAPDLLTDASNKRPYRLYTWSSALHDYHETVPAVQLWDDYRSLLSFNSPQPIFLPDLDGDGLPDLVQARHVFFADPSCLPNPPSGRPECLGYDWYYAHNSGNGTFAPIFEDPSSVAFAHSDFSFADPSQNVYLAPLSGSPFASLSTSDGAGRANLFAAAALAQSFGVSTRVISLAAGDSVPNMHSEVIPYYTDWCAFGNFQGRGSYDRECFDPGSVGSADSDPGHWRITTFDVEADGRADLLAYNFGPDASGKFQVEGLSYRVYYDAAGVRHQDPITRVPLFGGDFDGDGIQDAYIYDRATSTSYIGLQTAPTRDLLVAVAEEGATSVPSEKVTYSQRWSPDPVGAMACVHPQRCLRRGMNVVVEHDVHQGMDVNAYEHHIYSYDDPRTDVHGRGFLGFATVREWNPDRPSETITTYDNVSSLGGVYQAFLPTIVQTYVPVDPIAGKREGTTSLQVRATRALSTYEHRFLNGGKSNFTHRASWSSTEWENPATLNWNPQVSKHFSTVGKQPDLRARYGSSVVDDQGNETHREDVTAFGVATVVDTDWEYRFPDWLINLVSNKRTIVTDATSGSANPKPRRIDYTYDVAGHLASILVEKLLTGSPELQQTTTFEYVNSHGLVTTITASAPGEAARVTHIEYDPEEGIFPRKTWNDLGQTTMSLYHPTYGVVSHLIDPNQVETKVWLDDFGRIVQTKRGDNEPVVSAHSPRLTNGALLIGSYVETHGVGRVRTKTTLDTLGRVVLEEHTGFDSSPIVQQQQYDVLGRLIFSSRPSVNSIAKSGTSYSYDPMDRVRTVVAPDLSTITSKPTFRQTDTSGPVPDPAAPVPSYVAHDSYVERDVDGRVVASTQVAAPSNTAITTKFAYSDFNQLHTITDPQQNVTTLWYDQRGRRRQLDDPDTGTAVTHYNGFGEVTSVDLPNVTGSPSPSTTKYTRDTLGRITDVASPDGASKLTWDTAVNGLGKLATRSGPDGTIENFVYDVLGKPQQRTWSVPGLQGNESFDVVMAYDTSGRLKDVTYPNVPGRATRFKATLAYNVDGYLQSITETDLAAAVPLWTVNARNADGHLLSGTTGNNVTDTRTYDPVTGRLSKLLAGSGAWPDPVLAIDYTYFPDGAVKTRNDSSRNRNETFDYGDGLNRLTGWHLTNAGVTQDVGYHHDPIGNLDKVTVGGSVTEVNTPDSKLPHALGTSSIGGDLRSFKSDARGRQYSATKSNRTVKFNELNLPRSIVTDTATTFFTYDAVGGRIKKTSSLGQETVTLGGLYERRTDSNTGTTQHIFYVPGSDGTLTQVNFSVTGGTKKEWREYVHPDALGSAIAVTDDVKGRTRFDSEPFGKRIQPSGAAFVGVAPNVQAGFTGHHMDDDLALVNMKGRIFDPAQRRFITPDPLVARPMNAQSYNRYSYVYNNPLNLTDPSGFCGREGEEDCPVIDTKTTSCIDNPYADSCGPGRDNPPSSASEPEMEAAPRRGRPDSIPSPDAYNGVHVPVLDAFVNSDAAATGHPVERSVSRLVFSDYPSPMFSQRAIMWNIIKNNFPPVDWVAAVVEPVYDATSDWVEDMGDGDGRMRDHSEAMTGALGGAALPFLIPGGGAVVDGVAPLGQVLSREAYMWEGFGQVTHAGSIGADVALESGVKYLGPGYAESFPGVFRSKDGLRQFRMMDIDLIPKHGKIGPHVHFESLNPLGEIIENNHVPLSGK